MWLLMKIKTKTIIHDCILDEYCYDNLKPNKIYNALEIDYESYRVINEIGEPILYPKYLFIVIDSYIPQSWIKDNYEDGQYFIAPPELNKKGFYEDFFDGDQKTISLFWEVVQREGLK